MLIYLPLSVSYCSSPIVGRGQIGFNDNDRDNVEDVKEEQANTEVQGHIGVEEELEEMGDDSDYGGSGDHEIQVFGKQD